MVTVSSVLAVALPWVAHRRLRRRETLREMYISSRPGGVIAWGVIGIVLGLIVLGAFVMFAWQSAVMWATVALLFGMQVALIERLVRYARFDPRSAFDGDGR